MTPPHQQEASGHLHRRPPVWALATLVVGVVAVVVLVVPQLVRPPLSNGELDREQVVGKDRIQLRNDRFKLQDDLRAALLQGLGGLAVLLGVYVAAGQLRLGRDQLQGTLQGTREQLELARQGQITERFTRAIDQLGDSHGQLEVVLGGIYALERIARDSPSDRPVIGEVLTAYVRSHASWLRPHPGQPAEHKLISEVLELQFRAPDVHAALTVLDRGGFAQAARLDLRAVDLRRANLDRADLHRAILDGAYLQEAQLRHADLQGASFDGADLAGATLERGNLAGAIFTHANLEGALFEGANLKEAVLSFSGMRHAIFRGGNLQGADLQGADLQGANLQEANLQGADLRANLQGADLQGADLQGADLRGATLHEADLDDVRMQDATFYTTTIWPTGFNREASGAHFSEETD